MIRPLLAATALVWAAQAEAAPVEHAGHDYYFGDLHAHTGLSLDGYSEDVGAACPDGYECGSAATVLEDARDLYALDFLALTEHGNGIHAVREADDWNEQLQAVQQADDPSGGFVTIPGVELWLWDGGGAIRDHRNLYLFGDGDQLEGLSLDELLGEPGGPPFTTDDCPEVFDWLAALEQTRGPALLIPHHPAVQPPGATDWTCSDLRFNPAVENYSEHGNSQWPSYPGSYDPVVPSAEQRDSTVDRALSPQRYGLRLGILGGTDSHDTRPGSVCDIDPRFAGNEVNYGGGLTVAVLPAGAPFDRAAVGEAIRERRTLATSGPRVPVHFEALAGGTVLAAMGEEVVAGEGEEVLFRVSVPLADAPHVAGATLVQPDEATTPMAEVEVGTWEESLVVVDGVVAYAVVEVDGGAYWAGVTCDDGGDDERELIWTSPIWIDGEAADDDDDDSAAPEDGCGCAAGAAHGSPLVALVAGWLVSRRRSHRA